MQIATELAKAKHAAEGVRVVLSRYENQVKKQHSLGCSDCFLYFKLCFSRVERGSHLRIYVHRPFETIVIGGTVQYSGKVLGQ
jgi:hypothetical protein